MSSITRVGGYLLDFQAMGRSFASFDEHERVAW